jgi:hypothetical protein
MSEEDRAAFESAYFSDDVLLDLVEEEEDGLVSDYVLGRLPETDRRRFEQSLLGSAYYRERVETTSRLKLRIAQHRAFDRRAKGAAPSRSTPGRGPHDEGKSEPGRLFPGRTGNVIAFALLALLLVAAMLSALKLRDELAKSRAAASGSASRASEPLPRPSTAVVPASQSVVLLPVEFPGPSLRRLARAPGTPLVLIVPARFLPYGTHSVSLSVGDPAGDAAWRSGRIPRDAAPNGADVALRLPAGIPAEGRSAVGLATEGPSGRQELSLGVLEITSASR